MTKVLLPEPLLEFLITANFGEDFKETFLGLLALRSLNASRIKQLAKCSYGFLFGQSIRGQLL
jgi:hypothetical protein